MKYHGLLAMAAALLVAMPLRAAHPLPSFTAIAVADPARPAADKAQDAERKPIEVLNFAGIRPGETIVDLMPGAGYYTRLFSRIAGPRGAVYAVVPTAMDKGDRVQQLRNSAAMPHYANIKVLVQPIANLQLPKNVDTVWTSQNYHDLHDPFMGSPDVASIDKAIFAALKPGGTYIVLDHAAAAGTGVSKTDDLHRIDPAAVKAEVTAAGFQFVGESDVLANAADDHTLAIFDPKIKGHTDRFIYKFRKPQASAVTGSPAGRAAVRTRSGRKREQCVEFVIVEARGAPGRQVQRTAQAATHRIA